MATNQDELFSSSTSAAKLRMESRYSSRSLFAAGSGTLKVGTAVSYDASTGHWAVWDGDGTNYQENIDGFVVSDDVALHASNEVIGVVMTQGTIHYDDAVKVNVTDGSYGTAAELQAELKTDAFRQKNLTVIGYSLSIE